jgi:hypothetical protein
MRHWPFTRSSRLRHAQGRIEHEQSLRREAERRAAYYGAQASDAAFALAKGKDELGRLAESLRILRVHAERGAPGEPITCSFQISDEFFLSGYRFGPDGGMLQDAIAARVHDAYMREYYNPRLPA